MSIDLDAIRRRAEAATRGPWKLSGDYVSDGIHIFLPPTTADAEFIAHAREDMPALLDEIDRLTGQLTDVTRERDAAVHDLEWLMSGNDYSCAICARDCRSSGGSFIKHEAGTTAKCDPVWCGPQKGDSNGTD